MKYLKIQNKGLLDMRLISLMGASTKRNDLDKIGQFGSGLKYSLAWLIRNNIDFQVYIGTDQMRFSTVSENIRDTQFDILYINDERTSITAQMGMDWQGWMIVREVYCNAKDEQDFSISVVESTEAAGKEDCTTFYLQLAGEIKSTYDRWGEYFLDPKDAMQDEKEFAIYPAQNCFKLFKQGILIHENKEERSAFTYDLKHATINELRQYTGYLPMDIGPVIKSLSAKNVETFIQRVDETCFEYTNDYNWGGSFKDSWKQAIGDAKIISKSDYDNLASRGKLTSESEGKLIVLPNALTSALCQTFPHVSAVRVADKLNSFFEVYNEALNMRIKSGLVILENCGYNINPELKWVTGIFGNPHTLARINIDEKLIMFSEELERKSMFNLVSTIIEENEHYISGFKDETREFQQHFIDLFTKGLLDKNEVTL